MLVSISFTFLLLCSMASSAIKNRIIKRSLATDYTTEITNEFSKFFASYWNLNQKNVLPFTKTQGDHQISLNTIKPNLTVNFGKMTVAANPDCTHTLSLSDPSALTLVFTAKFDYKLKDTATRTNQDITFEVTFNKFALLRKSLDASYPRYTYVSTVETAFGKVTYPDPQVLADAFTALNPLIKQQFDSEITGKLYWAINSLDTTKEEDLKVLYFFMLAAFACL